jgi:hypothetical protein
MSRIFCDWCSILKCSCSRIAILDQSDNKTRYGARQKINFQTSHIAFLEYILNEFGREKRSVKFELKIIHFLLLPD